MQPPVETRYARNGDVYLAYQVLGDGPVTFAACGPVFSNIEVMWENPELGAFMLGLAKFCRLVVWDKRGQGLSDRDAGVPTLEDRADDFGAVMDAVGVERAVVGGISEGGTAAAMFAATRPERAAGVVLIGTPPRLVQGDDFPEGIEPELWDMAVKLIVERWGTPKSVTVPLFIPSKADDPDFCRFMSRYERACCTPSVMRQHLDWMGRMDITGLLPHIRCPALVVHREDDQAIPSRMARYVAARIPDARLLILPGGDHVPWIGDSEPIVAALCEFITGERSVAEPDRVLATVLFTDIVSSTARAAQLGDAAWKELLDRHDRTCAEVVEQHRGRIVKTTGDGLLATFDGPARAVTCAAELRDRLRGHGIEIRAGVHTGEVERRGDDIGGIAVHICARLQAKAQPGEILVSRTVVDLTVGSHLRFDDRGDHALDGVPGSWQAFAAA